MVLNVLSICVTVLVLAMYFAEHTSEVGIYCQREGKNRTQVFKSHRMRQKENGNIFHIEDHIIDNESHLHTKCPGGKVCNLAEMKVCEVTKQKRNEKVNWREMARIVNKVFFYIFVLTSALMMCVCSILWYQTN